jgi:hypothetical protein
MNLLRSILAVLFAIVIANPACCCSAGKAEPAKVSLCCGGSKKKEDNHSHKEACVCPARNPKQVEDPPVVPSATVVELPPVLPSGIAIVLPPVPVSKLPQPDFFDDTGPPRLRLVLLQRFLI